MARILVVDDNKLVLNILIDILRTRGFDVLSAENGAEALALVKKEPPDLIITDYYMPEMDGAEFIKAIRRGATGKSDVPIIALAGSHQAEEKTVSAGASTFLTKPLHEESIMAAVTQALSEVK